MEKNMDHYKRDRMKSFGVGFAGCNQSTWCVEDIQLPGLEKDTSIIPPPC